ncbi:MAG: SDR family NAD(P)-dependent oxidoreductase, partial [Hyphomicrobiales bacterium]|nr:SDR family NAD(P)-dependent oxidoreductase [Hyphomicrobiales bacterium]
MAIHPALAAGHCAVITGGASGIGLAAAKSFAAMGIDIVIADLAGARLDAAAAEVAALGKGRALAVATDVSRLADIEALERKARDAFGRVDVLMNNAGVQPGGGMFGDLEAWRKVIDVNLWG